MLKGSIFFLTIVVVFSLQYDDGSGGNSVIEE